MPPFLRVRYYFLFLLAALEGCGDSTGRSAIDSGREGGVGISDGRDAVESVDLAPPPVGKYDGSGEAPLGLDAGVADAAVDVAKADADSATVDVAPALALDTGALDEGRTGNLDAAGTALDSADAAVTSCVVVPSGSEVDAATLLPDNVQFVSGVVVSTVAGGPNDGTTNGPLGVGLLSNPVSVAIEPGGSLVVADFDTSLLRRVSVDGTVSTLTKQSTFQRPFGLALSGEALYAQTDANPQGGRGSMAGTLWRVDRASGVASVAAANLGRPRSFAALSDGRFVLSDFANQRVRLLDLSTGVATDLAGLAGCPGSANGTGTTARFLSPRGVVVLAGNRIIVADSEAHLLREISPAGVVTTFAGDGVPGTIDGPRTSARFVAPLALAADDSGAVFVSDIAAHRIRRIGSDGTVKTVAGDGTAGFADGSGELAKFFGQEGLAVSADGKALFVADGTGGSDDSVPYHRVRKITITP